MSAQNLTYLERNWLRGSSANNALSYFRKSTLGDRKWILRHHWKKDINDEETRRRDAFDYLLGFYSIVEIALTVGFVDEIPPAFQKKHLPILSDVPMRRYYEVNYQLDLPRRLRERMQSGIAYKLESSPRLNSFFYEFLELTKLIERDADLECFLWALDGGWRGRCNFKKVEQALLKTIPLFEAIQTTSEKKSELQHALVGFCKFIQFCEGLSSLLTRMEDAPVAAEAMWLAHAYWFRQLDYQIGDNLKLAFKSLVRWQVSHKNKKALLHRVGDLTKLMQDISVPPMTKWRTGLTSKRSAPKNFQVGMFDNTSQVMHDLRKISTKLKTLEALNVGEISHHGSGAPSKIVSLPSPASPSGPLATAVVKVLQRYGRPMKVNEILMALEHDNYTWTAKKPRQNLIMRIGKLTGVKKVGEGIYIAESLESPPVGSG